MSVTRNALCRWLYFILFCVPISTVGISFLCHSGAEIQELPIWQPPYWISIFRLHPTFIFFSSIAKLDPENVGVAVGMSCLSHRVGEIITSGLAVAILDFWLPVTSNIVLHSFVEKLDPIIWGIAIEILTLASREAKIHLYIEFIRKIYNFRFAADILD
jgi:hypothetical protein